MVIPSITRTLHFSFGESISVGMQSELTRLTSGLPIFRRPSTDTFLASMCVFVLACLLYAKVSYLHCLRESVLLETTMRYSESGLMLRVIFQKGEQTKSIPDMLCTKVRTEPILWLILALGELWLIVRLGETGVVNASTIGSRGPNPQHQLKLFCQQNYLTHQEMSMRPVKRFKTFCSMNWWSLTSITSGTSL
jgi:hypothetical protein